MKAVSFGLLGALSCIAILGPSSTNPVAAQNVVHANHCVQYALIPKTVWKSQKVTTYRLVEETKFETEKVTTYRPVWKTETRERRVISYKPVVKTSFKEETFIEYQRVVEKSFREVTEEQTVYDTVTEMQDRERVVMKPVIERSFREEKYVVRKPVIETQMQTENVTVYKPVTTTHTTYRQTVTPVSQMTYQAGNVRNRLQFLRPGYYPNGYGQLTYKTGGFYWVPQQNAGRYQMQTTNVVGYTPQQHTQTSLVPETVSRQKPVDVTRFVDTIETRRVPYETHSTRREVIVEKVPVEVRKPRIVRTTKRIPIETENWVRKEIVRRTPVKETTYEKVETIEPYEVKTQEMVAETSERIVPKRVTRRVPVVTTQMVPVTEVYRVPLDAFGYPIAGATRELVEVRRPQSSGQVYYGNLQVEEGPVQVVESSTQNQQPRSVVVRERVPYVDDSELRGVEKPGSEEKNKANDDDKQEDGNKVELNKPPVPEGSEKGSGSDNVDLKKQGDESGDQDANAKKEDQEADKKPSVDPNDGEGKDTDGKKADGKAADDKKADDKKADDKKADGKAADGKKADGKKAEPNGDGKLNGPKNDG